MTLVILILLSIVVAGGAGVRFTRLHPLAVAAAIGLIGAIMVVAMMLASVSASFEPVAITFAGTFVGVAALALVGALIGAALRPRRPIGVA
ncbi:hypothetical protein ASE95_13845 [Sphingomonas sp. Leaf231]|uniref:hypothetical protein n=1 Tax=Sphingomonas sp. Leaf231 TaxID=1736301 RepID=UPI0006FEAA0D|nr:hypothetical protein [Sphingomonas sp. Leaf231]KQN90546.1 hypothetical protein ASE95_13845 [Sphingomonas sp. Leaf231]